MPRKLPDFRQDDLIDCTNHRTKNNHRDRPLHAHLRVLYLYRSGVSKFCPRTNVSGVASASIITRDGLRSCHALPIVVLWLNRRWALRRRVLLFSVVISFAVDVVFDVILTRSR